MEIIYNNLKLVFVVLGKIHLRTEEVKTNLEQSSFFVLDRDSCPVKLIYRVLSKRRVYLENEFFKNGKRLKWFDLSNVLRKKAKSEKHLN